MLNFVRNNLLKIFSLVVIFATLTTSSVNALYVDMGRPFNQDNSFSFLSEVAQIRNVFSFRNLGATNVGASFGMFARSLPKLAVVTGPEIFVYSNVAAATVSSARIAMGDEQIAKLISYSISELNKISPLDKYALVLGDAARNIAVVGNNLQLFTYKGHNIVELAAHSISPNTFSSEVLAYRASDLASSIPRIAKIDLPTDSTLAVNTGSVNGNEGMVLGAFTTAASVSSKNNLPFLDQLSLSLYCSLSSLSTSLDKSRCNYDLLASGLIDSPVANGTDTQSKTVATNTQVPAPLTPTFTGAVSPTYITQYITKYIPVAGPAGSDGRNGKDGVNGLSAKDSQGGFGGFVNPTSFAQGYTPFLAQSLIGVSTIGYLKDTTIDYATLNYGTSTNLYLANASLSGAVFNGSNTFNGLASFTGKVNVNEFTAASSTFTNSTTTNAYIANLSIGSSTISGAASFGSDVAISGALSVVGTSTLATTTITTATIGDLAVTNSSTTNATSTNFIAINATSTNLEVTNGSTTNSFTANGTTTNEFVLNGTTTNLAVTNASTTNATTTNSFISSLFATLANITDLIIGNATTTNFAATNASTTNLTALFGTTTNSFTQNATTTNGFFTNLIATLANITDLIIGNSTTTNAIVQNSTTTNAYIQNLSIGTSSSNGSISINGNLNVNGTSTLATTTTTSFAATQATTTSLYATYGTTVNGSSTNFFTQNLSVGSGQVAGNQNINGELTVNGTTTLGNNTFLQGSVTLGTSTSNYITVNGLFNSNLVPAANITYDLGSPSFYWRNGYLDSLTVNHIYGTALDVSSTNSSTFTVNSDNGTTDGEDASLVFFRGLVTPNAVIRWNSVVKRLESNMSFRVMNETPVNGTTTLTVQGGAGQGTTNLFELVDNSGNKMSAFNATGKLGIGTSTPLTSLHIVGTDGIIIPVGTTAERPTGSTTGTIRYNTSNTTFEGFNGTTWGSLGGVIDTNMDTYVSAENTPGANNDELKFFTFGQQRGVFSSNGNFGIGTTTPGSLFSVNGNSYFGGNIYATGTLNILGNTVLTNASTTGVTATNIFSTNIFASTSVLTLASSTGLTATNLYFTNASSTGGLTLTNLFGTNIYASSSIITNASTTGITATRIDTNIVNASSALLTLASTSQISASTGATIGALNITGTSRLVGAISASSTLNLTGQSRLYGTLNMIADILPTTDIARSIGSNSLRFLNLFSQNIYASSSVITNASTTNITSSGMFYGNDVLIGTTTPTFDAANLVVQGTSTFVGTTASPTAIRAIGNIDNTATSTFVPRTTATSSTGSSPRSVYVSGNYAYVANLVGNTMSIIDISNPSSPIVVSSPNVGGTQASVYVVGRYAYVAVYGANSLVVLDVSNVSSPSVVSSTVTGSNPMSVYVSGRYAYVANNGASTMSVVDVSNPRSPAIVSNLSIPGSLLTSVYVSGNYAYTANVANNNVSIIDISNPANPTVASTTSLGINSMPSSVAVSGRYLYVVNMGSSTMSIIDISNPFSPSILSTKNVGSTPYSVYVSGRYAYVANDASNSLSIIDVSSSTSPVSVSSPSTEASPRSVYVSGRYAYISNYGSSTMSIINIGGLETTSALVHSLEAGNLSVRNDIVANGNIFGSGLAVGANGFQSQGNSSVYGSFSVGTSSRPLFLADSYNSRVNIGTSTGAATLFVQGTSTANPFTVASSTGTSLFTILANGNVGVGSSTPFYGFTVDNATSSFRDILPATDISYVLGTNAKRFLNLFSQNIYASSSVITNASTTGVTATNLFSANVYASSSVLTLASSTALTATTLYSALANITNASTTGVTATNIFTTNLYASTSVLTNASTTNITSGGTIYGSTVLIGGAVPQYDAAKLVVSGTSTFLANATSPTAIRSIGNIDNTATSTMTPTLVSTTSMGTLNGVTISGKYAYVTGQSNLRILDVSDPTSPTIVSSTSIPTYTGAYYPLGPVTISGRYAIAHLVDSGANYRFVIIDIANPANPVISYTAPAYGGYTNIYQRPVISGKYLYLNEYGAGVLRVIDISNPTSATVVGTLSHGFLGGAAMAVAGKYLYLTSATSLLLKVIDISNPANPTIVGSVATGGTPADLKVAGRFLYMVNGGGGVQNNLSIFDISSSTNPTLTASTSAFAFPGAVNLAGKYAFVTSAYSGSGYIWTYDVSSSTNPIQVSAKNVAGGFGSTDVAGRYLYANTPSFGFSIYDIGGMETTSAIIHSLEVGNLSVRNNINTVGNLSGSSLTVGAEGFLSYGNSAVYGSFSVGTSSRPLFLADSYNNRVNIGTSTGAATLFVQGTSTANPFTVASSTGSSLLTVLANGFVGVGTSTPSQLFTVGDNNQFSVSATGSVVGQTLTIGASGVAPVVVSGTVSPAVNGTYAYAGQYNSKNYYQLGTEYVWWRTGANQWIIGDTLGGAATPLWYVASVASTPPAGAYTAFNGASGSAVISLPALSYFTVDATGNTTAGSGMFTGALSASSTLAVTSTSTLYGVLNMAADILPIVDITRSIGSNALRFLNLFSQNIYASSSQVTNSSSTALTATNLYSTLANITNASTTGVTATNIFTTNLYASTSVLTNASSTGITVSNLYGTNVMIGTTTPTFDSAKLVVQGTSTFVGTTASPTAIRAIGNIDNTATSTVQIKLATSTYVGGTSVNSVAVSGRYVYTVNGSNSSMSIVDVSNPSFPATISTTSVASGPITVALSGNYAYVLSQTAQVVSIINITNPKAPTAVSTVSTDNVPTGMFISGHYVFVANNTSGFGTTVNIIDVSNPSSPVRVSNITTPFSPYSVTVSGKYAYVFLQSGSLYVIDITNPAGPVTMSTTALSSSFPRAYVSGRYLYVGNFNGNTNSTIDIVDVSNPSSPVIMSTISMGGLDITSVFASGRYLYAVGSGYIPSSISPSISVIDVSSSTAPVIVSTQTMGSLGSGGSSVVVSGRYAYVGTGYLSIYDIGGLETTSAIIHSLEAGNLSVRNDISASGNISAGTSLTVGTQGIFSSGSGAFTLYSTSTLKGSPALSLSITDSGSSSIVDVLSIFKGSTTTAATSGIGSGILFSAQNASGNIATSSRIASILTNTTNGSEASALTFYTRTSGAAIAERARITGEGYLYVGTTTSSGSSTLLVQGMAGINPFTVASSTGTSLFTILANGNVGIGTSSPVSLFSVLGTSTLNGAVNIGTTTSTGMLTLQATSGVNLFNFSGSTGSPLITLNSSGALLFGTTTYAGLQGEIYANFLTTSSTTATTTLAGNLNVGSGGIVYDASSTVTSISSLESGNLSFDTNAGSVSWVDLPVTSAATVGTVESYSAQMAGNPVFTVYAESDGVGGVRYPRIGIGTSTPSSTLDVYTATSSSNVDMFRLLSDVGGTAGVKFRVDSDGDVFVTGSTTLATTTTSLLSVAGNIMPTTDITRSIGSSALRFLNLFSQNIYASSSQITNSSSTALTATTLYSTLANITNASTTGVTATNIFTTNLYASTSVLTNASTTNITSGGMFYGNDVLIGTTTPTFDNANLVVHGTSTFVGNSNSLTAIRAIGNIDNTATSTFNPKLVGSLALGGTPYKSFVLGKYMYVANNSGNSLQIVDISNPTAPVLTGSLALGVAPYNVSVSGHYAYLDGSAANVNYLTVVDVTEPNNPVLLAQVSPGPAFSRGMTVSGNYAFVSIQGALKTFDITSPTYPVLISSLSSLGDTEPGGMVVSGNYLYFSGSQTNALRIIDISNPKGIRQVGSVAVNTNPTGLYVSGHYAYVSNTSTTTMQIIDIASSTAPSVVGSVVTGTNPYGVFVSGRYAYQVNNVSNSLSRIDVSSSTNPVVVNTFNTSTGPSGVYVVGRYAYVTHTNGTLQVIDLGGTETTSALIHSLEAGNLQVNNDILAQGMITARTGLLVGYQGFQSQGASAVAGNFSVGTSSYPLFFANAGLNRVNIGTSTGAATLFVQGTSTANPFTVASSTGTSLFTILANGNVGVGSSTPFYGFTVDNATSSFRDILPATDISYVLGTNAKRFLNLFSQNIYASSSVVTNASTTNITSSGNFYGANAFIGGAVQQYDSSKLVVQGTSTFMGTTASPNAIRAIGNIDNTASTSVVIKLISSISTGGAQSSVYVQNKYAYVTNSGLNTLAVVDVSNPLFPVVTGTTSVGTTPAQVVASGNYAYVVSTTGLSIVDISNPSAPVLATTTAAGIGNSIAVSGQFAYIATGSTMRVIDISNPYSPRSFSTVSAGSNPNKIAISGKYAYLTDSGSGLLAVMDISNPSAPFMVSNTASTGATPSGIAVSGKYVYTSGINSNAFYITDVSNPAVPVFVASSSQISFNASGVAVFGRYVILLNQSGSLLHLFDVSSSSNPILISSANPGGTTPNSVFVSGRYAYVSNAGGQAMGIFDLGGIETTSAMVHSLEAGNLLVRNDIFANGSITAGTGLNVGAAGLFSAGAGSFNVSTTSSLASVFALSASLRDNSTASILDVISLSRGSSGTSAAGIGTGLLFSAQNSSGNMATTSRIASILTGTASGSEGSALSFFTRSSGSSLLERMRLTDTGALFLGTTTMTSTSTLFVQGSSTQNILTLASNTGAPQVTVNSLGDLLVGTTTATFDAASLVVQGTSTFIGTTASPTAIRAIGNIDNTATSSVNMTQMSAWPSPTGTGGAPTLVVQNNYTYFMDNGTTFYTVDMTNKATPLFVSSTTVPSGSAVAAVQGKYAYLTNGGTVTILDISNASSTTLVSSTVISNGSVAVSGNYMYVGAAGNMYTYDISNPTYPRLVSTLASVQAGNGLRIYGKYAFGVSRTSSYLSIVDISNPVKPVLASTTILGSSNNMYGTLYVSGRYVFVQGGNADFTVVDFSNPSAPIIATSSYIGLSGSVTLTGSGKYLYVSDYNPGNIKIVDISNPLSPVVVSTTPSGRRLRSAAVVSGRYLYHAVESGLNGFLVYDVGGFETTAAMIHSLEAGNLSVRNDIFAAGNVTVGTGLSIGNGGFLSQGNSAVNGNFTVGTSSYPLFFANAGLNNINIGTSTGAATLFVQGTSTANPFTVASSTGASLFTILANGNVGIGTSSPVSLFSVLGTSTLNGVVNIGTTTSTGMLTLQATSGVNLFNFNGSAGTPLLTLNSAGALLFGTTTYAGLQGEIYANFLTTASTTATTTLAGNLNVGSGGIVYDASSTVTSISSLEIGNMSFDTNAGIISWTDLPVTSAAATGTVESYTAQIGGTGVLTVYSESNGIGGTRYPRIGINTSTPGSALDVYTATSTSNVDLLRLISDVGSTANVKFRVDSDGDIFTDGGTTVGSPADIAENYTALEAVDAGTVVAFGTTTENWNQVTESSTTTDVYAISGVRKAAFDYEAVGIVSTKAGITLGGNTTNGVSVAFVGRVPVKVTTENGVVARGDYLTVSKTIPGYAMKLTGEGRAIGRALSDYVVGKDKVMVLVENGYQRLDLAGKTATTSAMLTTGNLDLNANGVAITNIKSLASANGSWSIDENGRIVAKVLCLEDVCIDKTQLTNILNNTGTQGMVAGTSTTGITGGSQSTGSSTNTTGTTTDTTGTGTTTPPVDTGTTTPTTGTATPPVDTTTPPAGTTTPSVVPPANTTTPPVDTTTPPVTPPVDTTTPPATTTP